MTKKEKATIHDDVDLERDAGKEIQSGKSVGLSKGIKAERAEERDEAPEEKGTPEKHLESADGPHEGAKPNPKRKEVNFNTPVRDPNGGITYK